MTAAIASAIHVRFVIFVSKALDTLITATARKSNKHLATFFNGELLTGPALLINIALQREARKYMDCPACNNPMLSMELHEIEVDHCLACGGIWLDAGELELLLGDRTKAASLLGSLYAAQTSERHRHCPICRHAMEKVGLGGEASPVMIDRCRSSHGLWFDRDELPQVLRTHSFDPEHKVEKLLADMFGHSHKEKKHED